MSLISSILILVLLTESTLCKKSCDPSYLENAVHFFSVKENFEYYPWRTYLSPEGKVKFMMARGVQHIPEICRSASDQYYNIQEVVFIKIQLEYIEPGFFHSRYLEQVFIQYNNLKKIPNGLFNGTSLRSLVLNDNNIEFIEDFAFKDMHKLEAIALDYNNLKTFSPNWFAEARVLYEMNLMHNKLTELPEDTTRYMIESLDRTNYKLYGSINFDNNDIMYIHQDAFRNLRYFGTISLSNNKILELPDKLFNRFEFLLTLYMNTNSFICFTNKTIHSFHGVKRLFLGHNRINSECVQRLTSYFDWKNDLVYF